MSNETKGILASKTVLGAGIAALPALDQLFISLGWLDTPVFSAALSGVVSAVGAAVAIFGRIKAFKSISGLF